MALVGLNCATCHTGTLRETPTSPRQIIPGMPAHQMDLQGYANFLTARGARPAVRGRHASSRPSGSRIPEFSWFSSLLYRFVVVKRTRDGILERAEQNSWFDDRPPQGPGRVDTFNPYKQMFKFDLKADLTVGTADLPPLFNQRDPPGDVAALGRQQQSGGGAEQERGDRRGRDAKSRSTSPRSIAWRSGPST